MIQADKAAVKELDVNKLGFRYPNMADDEKIFEKYPSRHSLDR